MKGKLFLIVFFALMTSETLFATVIDFRNESFSGQGQIINGDEWLNLGFELSTPDLQMEVGCYDGLGGGCVGAASTVVQDFEGRMIIRFVDPGTTNQASTVNVNVDFCCEDNGGSPTDSVLYDVNGQVITTFTNQDISYQGGTAVGWIEVDFGFDAIYAMEFDSDPIEQRSLATFNVSKDFTDNNPAEVEVSLVCDSGIPLEQSFVIVDDESQSPLFGQVTFVVTDFVDGQTNCTVTENPVDNYTPSYDNGQTVSSESCAYTGVAYGDDYSCQITNSPDPATYTVALDWVLSESGAEEPSYAVPVTITCDSEILSVDATPDSQTTNEVIVTLDDGEDVTVTVSTETGDTTCSATQAPSQSGVEPEASTDCTNADLSAGGSATCTFTNTVFFEGIPTLSQYGLALLALLMLGVGFIGMRRFV